MCACPPDTKAARRRTGDDDESAEVHADGERVAAGVQAAQRIDSLAGQRPGLVRVLAGEPDDSCAR
jgi:hypothetical protein